MIRIVSLVCSILLSAHFTWAGPYKLPDCDALYFGTEGTKDLKKAFDCFSQRNDNLFLAIMYLNGEGVTADTKKAKEHFELAVSDHKDRLSLQEEEFKKLLDSGAKKVDFCQDLAMDTISMNTCAFIAGKLKDIENEKRFHDIKKNMNAAQTSAFIKLVDDFDNFRDADGDRIYQLFIDGSIRNIAASSQKEFLTKNFEQLIDSVVANKKIEEKDLRSFKSADKSLNDLYTKLTKEYKANYSENFKEIKAATKKAQRAWLRYVESWLKLAEKLELKQIPRDKLNSSVKHALTIQRIKEFENNPVGGG